MSASYLETILRKKVVFFTGKGGVGKSALASATALACQKKSKPVFLVSWNPFDVKARSLPYESLGIQHFVLESTQCFREYALTILKFESLVNLIVGNKVVGKFISAAPGLSEAVIAGKIWDLTTHTTDALVLVDLPSSGHAYSFFSSPLGLRKLFKVGLVHREIERICAMYFSPDTAVQLVTLPEELPTTETIELRKKLMGLGAFSFNPLILNQCLPSFAGERIEPQSAKHSLSKEDLNLVRHFDFLFQQQQEAEKELRSHQIPFLEIPKLTEPEWITTVEAIAELLRTL